MADELQPLIERLRREGVEKAEDEAEQILASAREKAAGIVREAEDKRKRILEQAKQEAETYTERSRKTLEQAARDILISVSHGIENIMSDLVAETVEEAMDLETVQEMLVRVVDRCAEKSGDVRWEVLVSQEDRDKLIHFFADLYKQRMASGIQLKADNDVLKGFKISFAEDHVYLDFTSQAVAESLSALLRPHLAEIVKRVASEDLGIDRIRKCLQQSPEHDEHENG